MTNLRLVITFLGVALLLDLGLMGYLAAQQLSIPDVLVAVGTGALGALGTLLVPTRQDTGQG